MPGWGMGVSSRCSPSIARSISPGRPLQQGSHMYTGSSPCSADISACMQWSFNQELLSQEKTLQRDCAAAVPSTTATRLYCQRQAVPCHSLKRKGSVGAVPQICDLQQRLGTWM